MKHVDYHYDFQLYRTIDETTGYKQGYLRIKQKAFPKSKFPLHVSVLDIF